MLYIEPSAGVTPIVQVLQSARREVDLNVYYLSDRKILSAIRDAAHRGVAVKVILDGRPYKMSSRKVHDEERKARATGASVRLAPARFEPNGGRYAFDHAKYICNGQECEIGSANFSWYGLHKNREYLYVTHNAAVVTAARAVFSADWDNRHAPASAHRVLVLSPGSEAKLQSIISQPGPVDIESEEMGDDRAILDAIAAKGHLARVILPASISGQDARNVDFLKRHGVQVRLMPKRPVYMHAKMMVGNQYAFMGSENFSSSSLNLNREMGLILDGSVLTKLRNQFDIDWGRAR